MYYDLFNNIEISRGIRALGFLLLNFNGCSWFATARRLFSICFKVFTRCSLALFVTLCLWIHVPFSNQLFEGFVLDLLMRIFVFAQKFLFHSSRVLL